MIAEVTITRVGLEGQGVGYDEAGNIYFVPGAIPGDRVRVQVAETSRKYRDAEIETLIMPSPDRQESECAYFPRCGGCDWLHWRYAAQIEGKEAILKHVLERGGLVPERFLPMIAASRPYGYRNRIQLRQEGKKLGFLKKRSQEIVDIERCVVADPRLNLEIARLREAKENVSVRHKIELGVTEQGTVERTIDRPHAYTGFRQINAKQNEALRQKVASHVERVNARRVLELFCGDGNLTFAYADKVEAILAVDANAAALGAARAAKPEAVRDRVGFLEAHVDRKLLTKLPHEIRGHYDLLVLDPPRTGVGRDIAELVHTELRAIVYVSCSPVSFSQDVTPLKKHFRLEEIQAIDMFPHTRHIEFVALFLRN